MAEDTNFLIVKDEHGFVFADLGFAGDFERAVVYVRRGGVAPEEDEVRVAVAPGINGRERR